MTEPTSSKRACARHRISIAYGQWTARI